MKGERASVATRADESNAGGRAGVSPLMRDMQAKQMKAMCMYLSLQCCCSSSLSSLLLLLGGNSLNGGRGTGSASEDGAGPVERRGQRRPAARLRTGEMLSSLDVSSCNNVGPPDMPLYACAPLSTTALCTSPLSVSLCPGRETRSRTVRRGQGRGQGQRRAGARA